MKGMDRRRLAFGIAAIPVISAVGAVAARGSVSAAEQGANSNLPSAALPKVTPFRLGQVRLNDGPFRDAETSNRAFMLRLSPDRLLHTFRRNAGLASTAQPLGGWEAPDCELRGHFTGHYLTACALAYATRKDVELKSHGDDMVKSMAECQAALGQNGYLSAFPQELFERLDARKPVWAPFYTYHKIMAGVLDMHVHAGNAQALQVVMGMAEWTDAWTAARTPEHMQDILNEEFGGMNAVLYDLAAVTGNARWIAVGDRFNKTKLLAPLAARSDELRGLHANTHIPQVIGAMRHYETTGDTSYRDMADFFWDTVTTARTYATGGSSNKEHWLTGPGHLAEEWQQASNHQECCCCYNMLKLTRLLFAHEPDARYMDYYERNLVNHRLGTIEPVTGRTTYFLSLAPSAWKTLATDDTTFWCCTGTAVEDFSKLGDSIYAHDARGVYVNQFIASTLDWTERAIRIEQTTDFPRGGAVALTVTAAPGGEWPIHVRIPAWTTEAARVLVNGQPVSAMAGSGSYLRITRRWKTGDKIVLDLPMPLHSESLPDAPRIQALLAGPVVLAAQQPRGDIPADLMQNQGPATDQLPLAPIALARDGRSLDQRVHPAGNAAHAYEAAAADGGRITFRPLYDSWDRFSVYLDVSA